MDSALTTFGVNPLREWYKSIGIETYIGSSNRIFPEKGIKPADVLRAIKSKLKKQGVIVKLEHEFVGFDKSISPTPLVTHLHNTFKIEADIFIFALGGGSWKVTGSDGSWTTHFKKIDVNIIPFQSSNCGLNISWPDSIAQHHIGKPLKNIQISHNNVGVKGEALISRYGLEGNAIYPISRNVGDSINKGVDATIFVDLKPSLSVQEIEQKLKSINPNEYRNILKLDSSQYAILKAFTTKLQFNNANNLAKLVKAIPIPISSLRPIEEAISTIGGIDTNELNSNLSLKKHPNMYTIGEMVNWDAPTGGFLLQACFSMGYYTAINI